MILLIDKLVFLVDELTRSSLELAKKQVDELIVLSTQTYHSNTNNLFHSSTRQLVN